jgi:hypothetical protein
MKDGELGILGFKGGEAVAEIGCGAVKGCAGEVIHRGDGGAERPSSLALEDVELGVSEKAELEGELRTDDESTNDAESAGLCERGCGKGVDEGCGCALYFFQMLGQGEGGVEFDPKTRCISEGSIEGKGELSLLTLTKWCCRRDARSVRLANERALPLLHNAPVMQHLRTLTVMHVHALKRESF